MHCAQKEFGTATFMDQFALIDAIHAIERTKKIFEQRILQVITHRCQRKASRGRERENILYTTCLCCKKF